MGLGKVSPKQGEFGRAKGDTKMLLEMSRSSKILGLKALLLLRGRRQQMSTQNCPNSNLSQRKSQKMTSRVKGTHWGRQQWLGAAPGSDTKLGYPTKTPLERGETFQGSPVVHHCSFQQQEEVGECSGALMSWKHRDSSARLAGICYCQGN